MYWSFTMESKIRIAVLVAFVTYLSVTGCLAQFSVSVTLSKEVAEPGDSLRVTCKVINKERQNYFIVWVRRIEGEEAEIGTNVFINEPFQEGDRYSANVTWAKPNDYVEGDFILDIEDVKPEDSGLIGCKIPPSVVAYKDFTVPVPLAGPVEFFSRDVNGSDETVYKDKEEIQFEEGEVRQVNCSVKGGYPPPLLEMYSGKKNITDQFQRTEVLVKTGDVIGLQTLNYEVTIHNKALPIDFTFGGKNLTCKASVPKGDFPTEQVGIKVKLPGFKPKFSCKPVIKARLYQRDFNITCPVFANPPVDDFKIYWTRKSGNENITLGGGKTEDGHYKADFLPGEDDSETVVVLSIDRLYTQHFRFYYFEAKNDLGTEIHKVKIQIEGAAGLTGGASSVAAVSYLVLALLGMMSLI